METENFSQSDLIVEQPISLSTEYLAKIGITNQPKPLTTGHIKRVPEDFIVEEITLDGRIVSIDPGMPFLCDIGEHPYVTVEVIKRGLATSVVAMLLAKELGISPEQVGFAGMKDEQAVTAQEFTVPAAASAQLMNVNISGILIKDITGTDEPLKPGSLKGNRFTIAVRGEPIAENILGQRLKSLSDTGFPNFYSVQRFGTRLLNHTVGQLILEQRYGDALHRILVEDSPHERAFIRNIRSQARESWGKWRKMAALYEPYPQLFRTELAALHSLAETPNPALALRIQPDDTRFYINAYMSFCFNRLLSVLSQAGTLPDKELPLPRLSPEVRALYAEAIPEAEWRLLHFTHPHLPFLRFYRDILVPAKVTPLIHSNQAIEGGHLFHFDLPKGAYATTFLSTIYSLKQHDFSA